MTPFARLLREVRACTACAAQLPLGPRPVLQAHPAARLLLASQAPGRKVHESGIPFDDASGQRLRAWLGLSPETFYDARLVAIVPMAFCYPGTGRSGDLPPLPECERRWRARLLAPLKQIELTVVIGGHAQACYDAADEGMACRRTITEAVRNWRRHWPRQLVLPHPSPRNNRWLLRNPWFEGEVLPVLQARVAEVLCGAAPADRPTTARGANAGRARQEKPDAGRETALARRDRRAVA